MSLGTQAKCLCSDRLADHFPNVPKMLLRSENVSQTDPHHGAAAQFRLRKISAPGSIDLLDNLAVYLIEPIFLVVGSARCADPDAKKPKTNHAHHNGRGQFETVVLLNPIGKEFGQAQVLANARGHSSAAERAPNDPRLERAKTATQLYAVIHVVDLGADRIAQVQMLRREREEPAQV